MTDILSARHRSWVMGRIRSRDTKPERIGSTSCVFEGAAGSAKGV